MRKLRKRIRKTLAVLAIVGCIVVVLLSVRHAVLRRAKPLVAELAPGAAPAIVRALGRDGLGRISQVISDRNTRTWYSGGTHRESGTIHGRPYGLAFDIAIDPLRDSDRDTHLLRMQGIAAWHRGPGAPGGPAGMGAHIHCVWPGYPTDNAENTQQIASFMHGWRGLADRDRPRTVWKDTSIRHDEIAAVRHVYERVHGAGTLARVKAYDSLHVGASAG